MNNLNISHLIFRSSLAGHQSQRSQSGQLCWQIYSNRLIASAPNPNAMMFTCSRITPYKR